MADSSPPIIRPVPHRPFLPAFMSAPSPTEAQQLPEDSPLSITTSDNAFRSPPKTPSSGSYSYRNGTVNSITSLRSPIEPPPTHFQFRTVSSSTNLTGSTLLGIYGNNHSTCSSQRQSPDFTLSRESPTRANTTNINALRGSLRRGSSGPLLSTSSSSSLNYLNLRLKERERVKSIISQRRRRSSQLHKGGSSKKATLLDADARQRQGIGGERGVLQIAWRVALLFFCGTCYGLMVFHLQSERPGVSSINGGGGMHVQVRNGSGYGWKYIAFWGMAGVGLGSLLPWVDGIWEDVCAGHDPEEAVKEEGFDDETSAQMVEVLASTAAAARNNDAGLRADWIPVVRSIGVFVGIAFAIRKLPWTSTLQVSLTLSLVNPVLWYLIDRSLPGLILSSLIGFLGTCFLLTLKPAYLPPPMLQTPSQAIPLSQTPLSTTNPPTTHNGTMPSTGIWDWRNSGLGEAMGALLDAQVIEGGIWIASVLFCSAVCFGGIGRRLALTGARKWGTGEGRKDEVV